MAAYLDHDIISGIGKQDYLAAELDALNRIMDHFLAGKCALTTSKLSDTELAAYKDELKKAEIQKVYELLLTLIVTEKEAAKSTPKKK